jgi:ribonuclease BN (tRNA processing enzyme)
VRITVLGKSPAWQDANGACSGYLIEDEGTFMLLDCGNGVFGKLRAHVDFVDVSAVVLSHLHADHFLDLVPYAYALHYHPRQQPVPVHRWEGTDTPARPKLYGPQGTKDVFRQVCGALNAEFLVEDAFDVCQYDPADVLEIGPLKVRFHHVPHFIPAWAVEVTSASGGGRFTFGADNAPCDELVEFARGTDLLMVEATLPRPERTGMRGHMTPAEAGEHGRRAGAQRLVITHFSDDLDEAWVRDEAARGFGGEVTVAREGATFTV